MVANKVPGLKKSVVTATRSTKRLIRNEMCQDKYEHKCEHLWIFFCLKSGVLAKA
jgi:hypothetical protein